MTANGNEAVTLKQLKSAFSAERGDINLDSTATGDEVVTLKQLKMLRDSLTDDILGQFSDELDTIIGADTTPIPDAIAWADKINGEDVSGGSVPAVKKYKVTSDSYNIFYPSEQEPGKYVCTVDGTASGSFVHLYDATNTYRICDASYCRSIDSLPPNAKDIVSSMPQTYAPPIGGSGYFYFIMPEEDVVAVTKN